MYSDVVRSKVLSQTRNPSALVLRFRIFFVVVVVVVVVVSNVLKKNWKFIIFRIFLQ